MASHAKLNHKFHKVVADLKSRLLQSPWDCLRASSSVLLESLNVCASCFLPEQMVHLGYNLVSGKLTGSVWLRSVHIQNAHNRDVRYRSFQTRSYTSTAAVSQCSLMPGCRSLPAAAFKLRIQEPVREGTSNVIVIEI